MQGGGGGGGQSPFSQLGDMGSTVSTPIGVWAAPQKQTFNFHVSCMCRESSSCLVLQ